MQRMDRKQKCFALIIPLIFIPVKMIGNCCFGQETVSNEIGNLVHRSSLIFLKTDWNFSFMKERIE